MNLPLAQVCLKSVRKHNILDIELHLRCRNRDKTFERAQNLIVSGIVWDLVRLIPKKILKLVKRLQDDRHHTHAVHIANDCCYARETCASSRDDTDILKRIFAGLPLAVSDIVQVCDGLTQSCASFASDQTNLTVYMLK